MVLNTKRLGPTCDCIIFLNFSERLWIKIMFENPAQYMEMYARKTNDGQYVHLVEDKIRRSKTENDVGQIKRTSEPLSTSRGHPERT